MPGTCAVCVQPGGPDDLVEAGVALRTLPGARLRPQVDHLGVDNDIVAKLHELRLVRTLDAVADPPNGEGQTRLEGRAAVEERPVVLDHDLVALTPGAVSQVPFLHHVPVRQNIGVEPQNAPQVDTRNVQCLNTHRSSSMQ